MSRHSQNREINNFYSRLASSINFKKANAQLNEYTEALEVAENLAEEINLTFIEERNSQVDLSSLDNYLNGEIIKYKEILNRLHKDATEIIEKMKSDLNIIQQEDPNSEKYKYYLRNLDNYKNWIYNNASLFIKAFLSHTSFS